MDRSGLTRSRASPIPASPPALASPPPRAPRLHTAAPSRRVCSWLRVLLVAGVLYVLLLLVLSVSRLELLSPRSSVASQSNTHVRRVKAEAMPKPLLLQSASQEDPEAVAKAEEHARSVRMLPPEELQTRQLRCIGWRATDDCSPHGPRLPHRDKPCHMLVPFSQAGYCEVEDRNTGERFRVMRRYCRSLRPEAQFRCFGVADFVKFPLLASEAVSKALVPTFTLPNVAAERQEPSQGIVMVVYPKMVPSAYASIRAIREVLHCRLPIELWFRPKEMHNAPGSLLALEQLATATQAIGITSFHEIEDVKVTGFGTKVHAIYHSFFERVLFLDADNVPVRDPSFLFESQEFLETGAVFWPDFWHPKHTIFNIHGQSLLWELLDQPFVNMFEQESGQLLVDRRRHAAPLELVSFYTFHRPNHLDTLKLAHGDKDLFRLAWLKLQTPFHMIETPPAVAGKVFNGSFCGVTMVQHDAQGEMLFLHRNSRKLLGEPKRKAVHLKTAAAIRARQKLLLTRPHGRTTPNWEEVEEEMRIGAGTPAPTLEPPELDGYPDAAFWTHVLSFNSSARRVHYKIDAHPAVDGFPKGQTCYGQSDVYEENTHFYFQAIANMSFAGLETDLRRFAMDAAQLIKASQTTGSP
ncbi:hypothetical protein BBJ28_00024662 [Nothophytophthora sp. Chile5]|nr:hypothetical protein BBJ28_00024662 [Nothophytophthora sp. Chile5]